MSDQTRLVIEGILDSDGFHQTNGTSFREWFNAHEAKVRADAKVEALREAADSLPDHSRERMSTGYWLRTRADNLEAS